MTRAIRCLNASSSSESFRIIWTSFIVYALPICRESIAKCVSKRNRGPVTSGKLSCSSIERLWHC